MERKHTPSPDESNLPRESRVIVKGVIHSLEGFLHHLHIHGHRGEQGPNDGNATGTTEPRTPIIPAGPPIGGRIIPSRGHSISRELVGSRS